MFLNRCYVLFNVCFIINLEKIGGWILVDLNEPLAYRMMPQTLDEYVGQEDILGKDKILYAI